MFGDYSVVVDIVCPFCGNEYHYEKRLYWWFTL